MLQYSYYRNHNLQTSVLNKSNSTFCFILLYKVLCFLFFDCVLKALINTIHSFYINEYEYWVSPRRIGFNNPNSLHNSFSDDPDQIAKTLIQHLLIVNRVTINTLEEQLTNPKILKTTKITTKVTSTQR